MSRDGDNIKKYGLELHLLAWSSGEKTGSTNQVNLWSCSTFVTFVILIYFWTVSSLRVTCTGSCAPSETMTSSISTAWTQPNDTTPCSLLISWQTKCFNCTLQNTKTSRSWSYKDRTIKFKHKNETRAEMSTRLTSIFSLAGNENKCCADYSLWMNNRFYCEYLSYLFKISGWSLG